jgi:hypothetical protein
MRHRWLLRFLTPVILASLVAATLFPGGAVQASPAPAGPGLEGLVPFLGMVSAIFSRNRTYRSAEEFIAERNRYYDAQRATLRTQLLERSIGGLRTSQVSAYIKTVAMIEAERGQAQAFAESIKRNARADFHSALQQELQARLAAPGVATQILGAIVTGLGDSQKLTAAALDAARGGGDVGPALAAAQRSAVVMQRLASLVAGPTPEAVRNAAADVLRMNPEATDFIQSLERAQDQASQGMTWFVRLQQLGLGPVAAEALENAPFMQPNLRGQGALQRAADWYYEIEQEGWGPTVVKAADRYTIRLVGLDQMAPGALEALTQILSRRSGLGQAEVRQRGLQYLQQGFRVRCRDKANALLQALQAAEQETEGTEEVVTPSEACQEVDIAQLVEEAAAAEAEAPASPPPAETGLEPFLESDCAAAGLDFPSVTTDYVSDGPNQGPYLNCASTDPLYGVLINPWSDPAQLDADYQKRVAISQGFVADANKWNSDLTDPALADHVTFLRNDADRYVLVITSYSNVQNCETGIGMGDEKIDGRFEVSLHYDPGICGPSDPQAYVTMMHNLEAVAVAAIGRVEGKTGP